MSYSVQCFFCNRHIRCPGLSKHSISCQLVDSRLIVLHLAVYSSFYSGTYRLDCVLGSTQWREADQKSIDLLCLSLSMIIGCSIKMSLTVNRPMIRQHSTLHKSINGILDRPKVELCIDVNRDGSVVGRTWKGWFELLLIPSLILHIQTT